MFKKKQKNSLKYLHNPGKMRWKMIKDGRRKNGWIFLPHTLGTLRYVWLWMAVCT